MNKTLLQVLGPCVFPTFRYSSKCRLQKFTAPSMLPLTISVLHFNCSVLAKVYSGIQTLRRSVPLLPLIISVSHVNSSVITKVYSGIQMFRRSVLLLPLIIYVSHVNCSVITKVYSGIQMFRRSVPLLPLIICFSFQLFSYHKGLQWHPDVSSECVTVVFNNFLFFISTAQLSQRFTVASRCIVGVCHCCL